MEYDTDVDNFGSPQNVVKAKQYDYKVVSGGSAFTRNQTPPTDVVIVPDPTISATLLKSVETTYLQSDASYNQVAYLANNLVKLVIGTKLRKPDNQIVAQTEIKYDETNYGNGYRGQATTVKSWLDTNDSWIEVRSKYDTYGNAVEMTDAKGNVSTTEYSATYNYAFPTKVTTPVPDSSGGVNGSQTAFQTTMTYNPTTGLPLTVTDANGLETRIQYDAITLRPLNTKTFYQNVQVSTTAETIYHDEPNNYWVKSRTQIDATNWAESITYFDGLGRAYKAEKVDSKGNIFVEKEFDAQGRVKRVTNPFRTGETKQWTTNTYDEASRIKEVILPDGTKDTTTYGVSTSGSQIGIVVTITDQANKQRRSITNAFGELIRVDESDINGSLGAISSPNQATYYNYNGIGKMVKVTQGIQNRFFLYDSIGRLLRVRQPEQNINSALNTSGNPDNNSWTAGFTYDGNSNILTATDAKNVVMTYV